MKGVIVIIGLIFGVTAGFFTFNEVTKICGPIVCKTSIWLLPLIPIILMVLISWAIENFLEKF